VSRIRLLTCPLPALVAALVFGAGPWAQAKAQLRLPTVTLPAVPLKDTLEPVAGPVGATATNELSQLRRLRIQDLVRKERKLVDVDRAGEPIVRGELLAFAPTAAGLDLAATEGMTVLRRQSLADLGVELVVLAVPTKTSIHRALKRLRKTDPTGTYDYNHLYLSGGRVEQGSATPDAPATTARASTAPEWRRIGLIDSGVDAGHPAFREVTIKPWGCAGASMPDAHGTAVASLIAGRDPPFHGAAPGSTVYAADVYCGRPQGGSVDTISGAFSWLVTERVPVINVSLVGPHNATLAAVVARVIARGYLIVAAVGNDGPAALPLYPAAYAGVVAVTGVDAKERVLVEANRGPHVAFAAPGADMVAAADHAGYAAVRGTSFAVPIVAGLLAAYCAAPEPVCATDAVAKLARQAIDLGARGRDPVYGFGLVGRELRIAPKKT
jgi:hypothetical protein